MQRCTDKYGILRYQIEIQLLRVNMPSLRVLDECDLWKSSFSSFFLWVKLKEIPNSIQALQHTFHSESSYQDILESNDQASLEANF